MLQRKHLIDAWQRVRAGWGALTRAWVRWRGVTRDVWMLFVTVLVAYSIYAIQAERANNVRSSCEQTNARNAKTKAIVDSYPDNGGRAAVYLLIDALAPPADCEQLVKERVGLPF